MKRSPPRTVDPLPEIVIVVSPPSVSPRRRTGCVIQGRELMRQVDPASPSKESEGTIRGDPGTMTDRYSNAKNDVTVVGKNGFQYMRFAEPGPIVKLEEYQCFNHVFCHIGQPVVRPDLELIVFSLEIEEKQRLRREKKQREDLERERVQREKKREEREREERARQAKAYEEWMEKEKIRLDFEAMLAK